jgi:sugar phosphate isomerase/epimerase
LKIAAQTVIWGNRLPDLARMLDIIAASGCEGVEFSQRPDQLGEATDLRRLLAERGLALVGFSGGTVDERIRYCADVLRPEYLYVERWDQAEEHSARSAKLALALHPGVFKPVHRLSDAEAELRAHPELRFLPDIVHLTIAGDSPANAIAQWRERIVGIHIKDWTPAYGRSSHRFARGFVGLGKGIVNFVQFFERLHTIGYKGWLVIEQGSRETPPEEVVSQATRWLAQRLPDFKRRVTRSASVSPPQRLKTPPTLFQTPATSRKQAYSVEQERAFFEAMLSTAYEGMTSYPRLSNAVGRLLNARLVILCACSPAANLLGVIGVYPVGEKLGHHFLEYRDSLSSVAVERQAVTTFDLRSAQPGMPFGRPSARFGYSKLIQPLGFGS